MTADIIEFSGRPQSEPKVELPAIDAWIDEVDGLGPFPNPIQASCLLARCPDPSHELAAWLRPYASLATG